MIFSLSVIHFTFHTKYLAPITTKILEHCAFDKPLEVPYMLQYRIINDNSMCFIFFSSINLSSLHVSTSLLTLLLSASHDDITWRCDIWRLPLIKNNIWVIIQTTDCQLLKLLCHGQVLKVPGSHSESCRGKTEDAQGGGDEIHLQAGVNGEGGEDMLLTGCLHTGELENNI